VLAHRSAYLESCLPVMILGSVTRRYRIRRGQARRPAWTPRLSGVLITSR
jgi:hypothetical protein